jgi:hypothetical protein
MITFCMQIPSPTPVPRAAYNPSRGRYADAIDLHTDLEPLAFLGLAALAVLRIGERTTNRRSPDRLRLWTRDPRLWFFARDSGLATRDPLLQGIAESGGYSGSEGDLDVHQLDLLLDVESSTFDGV